MSNRPPRFETPSPARRGLAMIARPVAAALVAMALGGCLGRGPGETTGSIDPRATAAASPDALRAASERLGQRLEAEPGNAAIATEYAQVLRALGQNAQAVAVLQQATIRNPRELPVLAAYGKALADTGRLQEAADVLSRAHLPERPDWRILSVQGAIAGQLGDLQGATRYYATALKIAPGEPSILSNMGLTYALAKRLGEAETILLQAAADPRADSRVRQNLALVLGLQGKFGDAEAVLKRDLPPAEAAQNLAAIKAMMSQPNSWKALGRSGKVTQARPASTNGDGDPT